MTKPDEIQQLASPLSVVVHSNEDLEKGVIRPRHLSMDTGSDVLHHSLSDEQHLLAPDLPPRRSAEQPLLAPDLSPRGYPESEFMSFLERQFSFREEFNHAAAETYLVTRWSFTLLRYLGIGYRWMTRLAALGLYALFITPGCVQVGCHYFYDKRIHRSVVYGQEPRNRLDLYLPENLETPKPVVVFVTGGAWIIGYKAWGSLLGLQLVDQDVIVACIDYRNFPQGTISDMVTDVCQGISFICNNISSFGGDPDRLYLAGQSAGAHIAACALVEQVKKESERSKMGKTSEEHQRDEAELTWRASQFKTYFGISGGYNLYELVDHFHSRGLYRILFLSIMEGEGSFHRYSPELQVQCMSLANDISLLPPIYLFHGAADYSIPCDASTSFAEVLTSLGVRVTTKLYEGKTHTDLFLQDPMRGGYDALSADILAVVHAGDTEAQFKDLSAGPRRRLVPECLLQLAHNVSPF